MNHQYDATDVTYLCVLKLDYTTRNHASNYITLTSNSVSGWLPRKILAGVAVLALEILWPEIVDGSHVKY